MSGSKVKREQGEKGVRCKGNRWKKGNGRRIFFWYNLLLSFNFKLIRTAKSVLLEALQRGL